ncbi:unnamed protein product [Lampetra fluviatilis]
MGRWCQEMTLQRSGETSRGFARALGPSVPRSVFHRGALSSGPPNRRFIISYATAVAQRCCNPGEGGGYGGGAHNDGTTSFDHPLGEQAGDTALLLLTNQISESSQQQQQQQQPPQQQQQFYHHQQQQQHQQQHQHHHHHQQQQSSTPPPVPRHQSHHYQQQQQHQQQHHLLHPHHYQQYQQHQHHHQQQQQLGGGSGGGGEEEALLVVCDAAPARPVSVSSGNSATAAMSAHPAGGEHDGGGAPPSPVPKNAKGSRKLQNFGKRSHSIRRNPNAPVMIRGWLHKQDSTGMKLWKKRWFVLSDFCLFYYKDNKEEGVLGSISLPSFQVNPVEADDKINRKFAFKARHAGMRTYYFGADSLEEMRVWMKAMAQASQLQMEIPQGCTTATTRGGRPRSGGTTTTTTARGSTRRRAPTARPRRPPIARPPAPPSHGRKRRRRPAWFYVTRTRSSSSSSRGRSSRGRCCSSSSSCSDTARAGWGLPAAAACRRSTRTGLATGRRAAPARATGRVAAVAALEREREREKRNSMVQLEQWMQSQKEKNEGDRLSIASTQTLPRSMPSYRQSLVVVGAPYPDGYTSLPRHAAAASSSLSRRPPGGAAGPAVPYGAGGGAGGSAGGHGPPADVVSELFEWRQRQVLRHGGHSTPPTLYSMAEVDESDGAAYGAGGDPAGSYGVTRARSRSERSPGHRRSHAPAGRTLDRRPMPSMVYTSTPQSIPPSLQGRTPEELTLLLIQLRRNQAVLAEARDRTLAHLLGPAPAAPRSQSLAPSLHLQRNLRFIESQMKANEPLINTVQTIICCRSLPFRPQVSTALPAERTRGKTTHVSPCVSFTMKLTRLCDQNKTLHEQETRLRQLRNEKARIESSLEGLHLQIAQRRSQPELLHEQQQRLQADLVHIRADSARLSLDLERSVSEYKQLESDLLALRVHLEDLLSRLSFTQTEVGHQQRAQVQRDLWRIQDVMGGLGQGSWDVTTAGGGPVGTGEARRDRRHRVSGHPHLARDPSGSPPRAVGPHSPLRSSLVRLRRAPPFKGNNKKLRRFDRNTSGDDRLCCDRNVVTPGASPGSPVSSSRVSRVSPTCLPRVPVRRWLSPPVFTSLVGVVPPLSQPGQMQSTTIASYVTLRRAKSNGAKASSERPKSAMDALYPAGGPAGGAGRGKMSVEEQLERLKLNQKAAAVAAGGGGGGDLATTVTPAGGSGRAAPRRRGHTMTLDRRTILAAQSPARPASVDVSQQVSPPRHHVLVPERYVDEDPEEPLSPLEMEARQKNVERIKAMLAKSSVQNVAPLPSPASREVAQGKVEAHVQEQERIISMSCALAAEACQRSKAVAAKLTSPTKGASPSQDASAPGGGSHFAFV